MNYYIVGMIYGILYQIAIFRADRTTNIYGRHIKWFLFVIVQLKNIL